VLGGGSRRPLPASFTFSPAHTASFLPQQHLCVLTLGTANSRRGAGCCLTSVTGGGAGRRGGVLRGRSWRGLCARGISAHSDLLCPQLPAIPTYAHQLVSTGGAALSCTIPRARPVLGYCTVVQYLRHIRILSTIGFSSDNRPVTIGIVFITHQRNQQKAGAPSLIWPSRNESPLSRPHATHRSAESILNSRASSCSFPTRTSTISCWGLGSNRETRVSTQDAGAC
jgi:hypothetical protein